MSTQGPTGPVRRLAARIRSRTQARHPASSADEDQLRALGERIDALEAMVEGLQDALYRHAVHADSRLDDLARRVTPEELARSLSADARRRGL